MILATVSNVADIYKPMNYRVFLCSAGPLPEERPRLPVEAEPV